MQVFLMLYTRIVNINTYPDMPSLIFQKISSGHLTLAKQKLQSDYRPSKINL